MRTCLGLRDKIRWKVARSSLRPANGGENRKRQQFVKQNQTGICPARAIGKAHKPSSGSPREAALSFWADERYQWKATNVRPRGGGSGSKWASFFVVDAAQLLASLRIFPLNSLVWFAGALTLSDIQPTFFSVRSVAVPAPLDGCACANWHRRNSSMAQEFSRSCPHRAIRSLVSVAPCSSSNSGNNEATTDRCNMSIWITFDRWEPFHSLPTTPHR